MVARNFTIQELPYSKLLHVPDGERDYLSLDEPISLHQLQPHQQYHHEEIYYELPNVVESSCTVLQQYQLNHNNLDVPNGNNVLEIHHVDSSTPTLRSSRKRKTSTHDTSDNEDDNVDDCKSVRTNNDENKKQNHSEIEKRRRDKMNTYITELSSMIPMCHAMSRKLDKLTVLRMAVQHLKTIRGAVHSYTEGLYKPSFLSDKELKRLILQAADGFLFVVGCDRGRILYVSASVSKILNYTQGDLLGQSLFDILHPKDVAKVKEQLSSSDLNPRERLIDAKTMLPVKTDVPLGVTRLCPGARRSFFCRMKCKSVMGQVKEEADTTTGCHRRKKQNSDKKYNVIQCTGYLKSWTPAKIGLEETEGESDSESCNLSCLVAIGRMLPQITATGFVNSQSKGANIRNIQFVSRHTLDGKFLFVDQRATLILGFLPQELLGSCMYEYYHHDDIHVITECHKLALQTMDKVNSKIYRFRCKSGSFVRLQTEWKAFKNPWTKEIEYLIAKNNLILTDTRTVESSANKQNGVQENFDFFSQTNGKEMQLLISSHVEASKIGRQIADQAMDSQKRCGGLANGTTSSSSASPDPDPESSVPVSSAESHISTTGAVMQEYVPNNNPQTYNNVTSNTVVTNDSGVSGNRNDGEIMEMMENAVRESPNNGPATDGNDEAAMAVIMSLLEADAGLGGPVDFSGLPWPLP